MDDARLCLEAVLQAELFGAHVFNYVSVVDVYREQNNVSHVVVTNEETKEQYPIRAKFYINTTGPFCDEFLTLLNPSHQPMLRPSKGVHVFINKLLTNETLLLESDDKRVFFIIPWQNQTLVGTTDTDFQDNIQNLSVTQDDKEYLLKQVNYFFPDHHIDHNDISSVYVGIRPLVVSKKGSVDISAVSRKDTMAKHASNFYSVIGGKYTTFRSMAERVVRRCYRKLHLRFKPLTKALPLHGGEIKHFDSYVDEHFNIEKEIFSISEGEYRHIVAQYGSVYHKVFSVICEKPEFRQRLTGTHHLKGEVVYAIRYEHAKKLEDFFRRRTQLFFQQDHGLACLDDVAALYQAEHNWTESETNSRKAAFKEKVMGLSQVEQLFNSSEMTS